MVPFLPRIVPIPCCPEEFLLFPHSHYEAAGSLVVGSNAAPMDLGCGDLHKPLIGAAEEQDMIPTGLHPMGRNEPFLSLEADTPISTHTSPF